MIHVTASTGSATFPDDGATLDELFRVADGVLYAAKEQPANTRLGPSRATRTAAGA